MEAKTIEALKTLSRVLSQRGRRFVLIGAMVPQIVLDFHKADAPGSRETRDVDAVAEVSNWQDFIRLCEQLGQEGFRQGRAPHELLWDNDIRIDLIPFGPALIEHDRLSCLKAALS